MNEKDALAILGKLALINPYCQNTTPIECFNDLEDQNLFLTYLESLDLPYQFVLDVLDGFYGIFYHQEFGGYDTPLTSRSKKVYSEFDYVCVDSEAIRIGVWCEVDGFIAWLDEYKTHWFVDSKKQIIKEREKRHKWFEEHFSPIIKKVVEEVYSGSLKEESLTDFNLGSKTVKIQKIKFSGLSDYKRKK